MHLRSVSELREVLAPFIKLTDRIMIVGCGNSTLSFDMHTNVRVSPIRVSRSNNVGIPQPGKRGCQLRRDRKDEAAVSGSGMSVLIARGADLTMSSREAE